MRLLPAIALTTWILLSTSIGRSDTPQMREYADPDQRFKLKYPAEWSSQKPTDASTAALFTAKASEDDDPFLNAVKILYANAGGTDLKASMNTLEATTEKTHGQILIASEADMKVNGHAARKAVFSGSVSGHNVRWVQVLISDGKGYYQLAFETTPKRYRQIAPTIDAILNSFEIGNAPAKKLVEYTDDRGRFKMKYPDGWENIVGIQGCEVMFGTNERPTKGDIQDTIQVGRRDDISDLNRQLAFEKAVMQKRPGFKLIQELKTSVDGHPATKLASKWTQGKEEIAHAEVHFLVGKVLWTLTLSVDPDRYDALAPTFDAVVKSFTLVEKK
jgi:hypothetical protein